MKPPIGKILGLPISYNFNNYLTEIKEVCRMRNSLLFWTKIVFNGKKHIYFTGKWRQMSLNQTIEIDWDSEEYQILPTTSLNCLNI